MSKAGNERGPLFRIEFPDFLVNDQACGRRGQEQLGIVGNQNHRTTVLGMGCDALAQRNPHARIEPLLGLVKNQER